MKHRWLVLVLLVPLLPPVGSAGIDFSDEEALNDIVAGNDSRAIISERRSLIGNKSLEWSWEKHPATLEIKSRLEVDIRAGRNLSTWIYNEEPLRNGRLRFEFIQNGNRLFHFDHVLNYRGWRRCYVDLYEDVSLAEGVQKNRYAGTVDIRVTAPTQLPEGRLYFGDISATGYDKIRMADQQQPFVNGGSKEPRYDYLMPLNYVWSLHGYDDGSLIPEPEARYQAFDEKFLPTYAARKLTPTQVESLLKKIAAFKEQYGIRKVDGAIKSNFIDWYGRQPKELVSYIQHSADVATAYHNSTGKQKAELRGFYLLMIENLFDQGWAGGSARGTIHHLKWPVNHLARSFFPMKNELEEAGLLLECAKLMIYMTQINLVWEEVQSFPLFVRGGYADHNYHGLLGLMLLPNGHRRPALAAYRQYLDAGLDYHLGNTGGIKADGGLYCFHVLRTADGLQALKGLAQAVKALDGSEFEIAPGTYERFKYALLRALLYTADGSRGVSATQSVVRFRSPLDTRLRDALELLAAARPDGDAKDSELEAAARYLMREGDSSALEKPQGVYAMNSGGAGFFRYGDFSVHFRGHMHTPTTEVRAWYPAFYPWYRYQGHGCSEIFRLDLHCGQVEVRATPQASDFDWSALGGSTALARPHTNFSELRFDHFGRMNLYEFGNQLQTEPVPSRLQTYTPHQPIFCGASHLRHQSGLFALAVNRDRSEKAGIKNERANFISEAVEMRKSAFLLENGTMVYLGSDISNEHGEFETTTTLFQRNLAISPRGYLLDGRQINPKAFEEKRALDQGIWLDDPNGCAWRLTAGSTLKLKRHVGAQFDYLKVQLSHGHAPEDGNYEYAVILNDTPSKKEAFDRERPYEILRRDRASHQLLDLRAQTAHGAFFEGRSSINALRLSATVEAGCLLSFQKVNEKSFGIGYCDLEQNFFGTNRNQPSVKTLTLKGAWDVSALIRDTSIYGPRVEPGSISSSIVADGTTTVRIASQFALPFSFTISPIPR